MRPTRIPTLYRPGDVVALAGAVPPVLGRVRAVRGTRVEVVTWDAAGQASRRWMERTEVEQRTISTLLQPESALPPL